MPGDECNARIKPPDETVAAVESLLLHRTESGAIGYPV